MYTPRVLESATRQLKKMDPPVARRILDRIEWLARHFEEIAPEPLHGDLSGLFKLREGDYRIIYQPLLKEPDMRRRGAIEGYVTGLLIPKYGISEEH